MRKISTSDITNLVERLCIEACCVITDDISNKFKSCLQSERSPLGKQILHTLIENARIARDERSPICQDTRIYFAAIGGAAALMAQRVESAEVIAFEEFGTEAIRRLHVKELPVVVAIDCYGNDIYKIARERYQE